MAGDSPAVILFGVDGQPVTFGIVVSTGNTSTIPLGAGASFTGAAEDVTTYHEVDINLGGAPANAPGTLYFEFSPDGTNWDVSVPLTLDGPSIVPLTLRVILPFFRVRYINGATPQTEFRLTTVFHKSSGKTLTRFLNQYIDYNEPVENMRAFISGARPDGSFGNVPVSRDNFLKISIDDIGPIAEDRLVAADKSIFGSGVVMSRVSETSADFSKSLASLDITSSMSGTGYVIQPDGYVTIATGAGATSYAKVQTNTTVNYAPARELYGKFSVSFRNPSDVNSWQRAGIYNDTDGFFVGYTGLTFGVTVRKNSIDTFTPISNFNGDLLDGNPNSTFTRDGVPEPIIPYLANIYRIRFGGSVAPIFFQVLAPDSQWVTFHEISDANITDIPVIGNPNLPLTIESIKTGSDSKDLMIHSTFLDGGAVADVISNQLISLNTKFNTLGQKAMSGSVPVVIASDQSPIPVTGLSFDGYVNATNLSVGVNDLDVPDFSTQIGASDGYVLRSLRAYDVDTGPSTEYALGVTLRKPVAGGSVPLGTETDPFITFPAPFNTTTFGETRVANPYTIVDLVNKYDISSLEYGTAIATGGSVTHQPNESAIRLTVTGTSGSSAKLRTNAFYRYQAGKSFRLRMSLYNSNAGNSNQVRRWGFFDDNDGLFFELNGTDFRLIRRTFTSGSPVDNVILRSTWNGDKLDGEGRSGVTLDIAKANIYEIQFQWFGVGIVRFFINGILVHELDNQNTLIVPYMRTAQLPLHWEVVNTGASSAASLTYICGSVTVEGGQHPPYYVFGAFNSIDKTVTVVEVPVLSIRPKSTFNSITNRMLIQPFLSIISCEGGRSGYRFVFNGSLTGAAWASADSNSGVEFDTTATLLTGGSTVLRGFLPSAEDSTVLDIVDLFQNNERGLKQNAFATGVDVLTIMGVNEAAGTTAMRASVTWKEIR